MFYWKGELENEREREKERKGVLTITLASLCEIHQTEQNNITKRKREIMIVVIIRWASARHQPAFFFF